MRKPVAAIFCGLIFSGQAALAWECRSGYDLYELDGQEVCLTPQQAAQAAGATATEGEDTFHRGAGNSCQEQPRRCACGMVGQ